MLHGSRIQGPARDALEWLFPKTCSLCGEVGAPEDPCPDCERSLDALLLRAACPRCAAPLPEVAVDTAAPAGSALPPCVACLNQPPPFDRVIAPWNLAPPLSSLIHRMKYRRDLAAAAALGRLLAREVGCQRDSAPPRAVIGMPLSRRRLLYRGFNHAAELAAIVRRTLGLPTPRESESPGVTRRPRPRREAQRNAARTSRERSRSAGGRPMLERSRSWTTC